MRERDDEPLPELSSELASLWRSIPAPDPTAGVDRPDAATRATVAWLQAAWIASAPAGAALPWRIRVRSLRRRSLPRLAPWLAPLLAAAALLFAVALLLPAPRRAAQVARGDLIVAPPIATAPISSTPVLTIPMADAIPLVAVDARRMEMRRGPVRLILVTDSKPAERSSAPATRKEPK